MNISSHLNNYKIILFAVYFLAVMWSPLTSAGLLDAELTSPFNRRQAYSENLEERLNARVALAVDHLGDKQFPQALTAVEEYGDPIPENLAWPTVKGYLVAAKIKAEMGQTFDAVHRINLAIEKSEGLGKVAALDMMSELIQEKPDLKSALELEKRALSEGNSYFKRKKISESAGLEPPKEGHEIWEEWKPIIEARIEELKELADIEEFGLDFVLYRKAQRYRRADHPRALDFVSIGRAFGLDPEGAAIPDVDYEAARKWYGEIIKVFPDGVYTEASKLFTAACLVHLNEPKQAIREWMAFYLENPDGLYRGEALKLIGDTYLTSLWDKRNAKEAYVRAIKWIESVSERTRILETYVVPEKSVEVSRPPKTPPRKFNKFGNIERESLGSGVLFNRLTASWYLQELRVQLEWRLGFLEYLEGNTDQATRHFDLALEDDVMLQRAQSKKFFNSHGRMMQVLNQTAMVETEEEMRGIKGDRKLAMEWADLMFMLGNYEDAQSLYRRIQSAAKVKDDGTSAVRAGVAEAYLIDAMNIREFRKEAPRLYGLCMTYPQAPATPALLFKTALMSPKEPITGKEMMSQLANEYPRSRYAAKARYTNIYRFTPWKEHETRAALTEAFIKDFPKETELIENLKKHDKRVRRLEEVGFDAY
jgi:tetratricopeptide (TPR) repeat protein